ncbi:MAG TPA: YHS domain-containing protein [Opitutales bacterium]|jgi:YHS domain-containing protein|nr:YHS domain-containing protein [Opitutales bacterium]
MKFKPAGLIVWVAVIAAAVALWMHNQPASTAASAPQPAATAATTTAVPAAKAPVVAATTAKPYPFATSVVSGLPVGPKDSVVTLEQDGYQVKLASAQEADTFKKNPSVYMAKITEAYQTAKPCPMTVCPVMGGTLDSDAFVFVYEGRQFKFCCDSCLDDFNKDPAKFVSMWDDAAAGKPITPTSVAAAVPAATATGTPAVQVKQ